MTSTELIVHFLSAVELVLSDSVPNMPSSRLFAWYGFLRLDCYLFDDESRICGFSKIAISLIVLIAYICVLIIQLAESSI